ncbi:MAG: hypothetical protein V4719_22580, partial [Planctomycetota bacterium]
GTRRLPVAVTATPSADESGPVADDVHDALFLTLPHGDDVTPVTAAPPILYDGGTETASETFSGTGSTTTGTAPRPAGQSRPGGKPQDDTPGTRSFLGSLFSLVRNRQK